MAWYYSRPIRMRDGTTVRAKGRDEWVALLFHPNKHIHETAHWMIDTKRKYDPEYRWSAWPFARIPPRIMELEFSPRWRPTPFERAASWLLLAWALLCAARSR